MKIIIQENPKYTRASKIQKKKKKIKNTKFGDWAKWHT